MVTSHPTPQFSQRQPNNHDALQSEVDRALRGVENDAMVRKIAARMSERGSHHPRERKHTKTLLRHLAWPVYVQQRRCTVAVVVHYVLSHPREHQTETFWFTDANEALAAFPKAQTMPETALLPSATPTPA
jgi:hypothetical protein